MAQYIDSLGNEITCDSTPVYDAWGWWSDFWVASDWITWHKKLKEDCGLSQDEANARIEQAWLDRGTFGHEWFFQFDSQFRDYFEGQGIDFSIFANIIYSVGKGTEDVVEGVGSTAKILKFAIPFAVIGIGLFYGYKAYQEFK